MSIRAAGFVIVRRDLDNIKFLILQASYGSYHWSTPKGHVDPGENESEAAFREVFEESGYAKEDLTIVPGFEKVLNYPVNGKPKSVTYWLAELKDPNKEVKLSHEHKSYKWATLEEALEVVKHANTKNLLQAAYDFVTKTS